MSRLSVRTQAALVVAQVVHHGRSLDAVLAKAQKQFKSKDAALLQALCYGCLRFYPRLDALLNRLLKKPILPRFFVLRTLMWVGLYQCIYLRVPGYAAVSETVACANALKLPWARALINGVLRTFLREQEALLAAVDAEPTAKWAHPAHLLELIQSNWPDDWQSICAANNEAAPMGLRINLAKISREEYHNKLAAQNIEFTPMPYNDAGLYLHDARPVIALPGFADGLCSVQDGAAQLAATLLQLAPEMRVLDACAAPGGKMTHILEMEPKLTELVALDSDENRLEKCQENLSRLNLSATLCHADACSADAWWDGELFDRILLDAPCSGTGVIRRHPDIKALRRLEDIDSFSNTQALLLKKLWPLLQVNGLLLYATCSIVPEENNLQIANFLAEHTDASEVIIEAEWGRPLQHGRQILPGVEQYDGFYYALLRKL